MLSQAKNGFMSQWIGMERNNKIIIWINAILKIYQKQNFEKYRRAARCGCVGNSMNFIVEQLL